MKKRLHFILALCIVWPAFLTYQLPAADGHLVIIGGGRRPATVIKKIIGLAGGAESRLLIIPAASSVPLDVALYQRYQFEKYGAGRVDFVLINRESVDADSNLALLDDINAVFFSGGDQRRLTKILLGSKMLQRIRDIYESGGVIAGTSAGAAVMSTLMITGDEALNPDSTRSFVSIQQGNIITTPGFGFVKEAIIDQHFIRRRRHNRLLSLVLEHPGLTGIGIDERTAIVVAPDRTFEVIGEGKVIIYDASAVGDIRTDSRGYFSANGIVMHLLGQGQRYNLKTKEVLP
jgi:cyanophycinase